VDECTPLPGGRGGRRRHDGCADAARQRHLRARHVVGLLPVLVRQRVRPGEAVQVDPMLTLGLPRLLSALEAKT